MRAVRLCQLLRLTMGRMRSRLATPDDVMRAVRLCALERLTMARRSSKGCPSVIRPSRYPLSASGASFARERGVRDDERISGKPLPVPGSRVIP
jgi:hypothetical protein